MSSNGYGQHNWQDQCGRQQSADDQHNGFQQTQSSRHPVIQIPALTQEQMATFQMYTPMPQIAVYPQQYEQGHYAQVPHRYGPSIPTTAHISQPNGRPSAYGYPQSAQSQSSNHAHILYGAQPQTYQRGQNANHASYQDYAQFKQQPVPARQRNASSAAAQSQPSPRQDQSTPTASQQSHPRISGSQSNKRKAEDSVDSDSRRKAHVVNPTYSPTSPSATPTATKAERVNGHGKLKTMRSTVDEIDEADKISSPDYQLLLLGLADQYINAARAITSTLARSSDGSDTEQYRRLMGHGMACLHSVIHGWQIADPKHDASLRLQYANLLFEETDNDDVAQAVLSQGITICDRSRLLDQKYSMQHLLARILHKTSPKSASKTIDHALEEVVTYKNIPWIYAFRLLKISLLLQSPKSAHLTACLQQVQSLAQLAERHDAAVYILASLLGALAYVRTGLPDAAEQAQRSATAARSYQMDKSLGSIPQLRGLILVVDLILNLTTHSNDQLAGKVEALMGFIDEIGQDSSMWRSSGFQLPTRISTTADLDHITSGVLRTTEDGKVAISLRWINKNELYMLGFLLCALAKLQKNCADDQAIMYLSEGIKYSRKDSVEKGSGSRSLQAAHASVAREESLSITMQLARICAEITKSNWSLATQHLHQLGSMHTSKALEPSAQVRQFLTGSLHQLQGNLEQALECYSSPLLVPPTSNKIHGVDLDFRLLASLNRVLILRHSPLGDDATVAALMAMITPLSKSHNNPLIVHATKLVVALVNPDIPILTFKGNLLAALDAAKAASDHLLLQIILNVLGVRFFDGIIGQQAETSAQVAYKLAQRLRSPLWVSVGACTSAKSLELHGRHDEASARLEEAKAAWSRAPAGVREWFRGAEGATD